MKLRNKNILLISPEAWNHIFVSKHHYATHLAARGNKVFFLNPPVNNKSKSNTLYENLWSIHYKGFPKGLRFYHLILQRFLIRREFKKLQQLCGVHFDIVWSFDNSVFYDFLALPKSLLKISHIVDLNQDFQTSKAATTADICFAVSHEILYRLKKYQKNSFFINHGFNNSQVLEEAQILPGNNKTKVALIGNLAMPYLDWRILLEIAKKHAEVDFVFYGPFATEFSTKVNKYHQHKVKLSSLNNAFFPGQVAANIIHNILKEVDILLVSYQEAYHVDQSNPHKMMEYLGSGKVVVATKTSEYQNLMDEQLIAMSDKNEEFTHLFQRVVDNLNDWNSDGKRKKRIDFALDNSYGKQINRIEIILNELIK